MITRTEREALRDSVETAGREPGLSNSAIAWFVEEATPGQLQAVDQLFARELATRAANGHARPLRQARFPNTKSVDTFDHPDLRFHEGYGWENLVGLGWLERRQDFVFHGPTWRGKTHLTIALGMLAVNQGRSAGFLPCAQLVLDCKRAQGAGGLGEGRDELGKADLLVLDEFGYIPLGSDGSRLLLQVMSRCYERQSMVVTTNIEFAKWGTVLADEKLAAALVDRIAHHGRLVEFGGESRRVSDSLMLGNDAER